MRRLWPVLCAALLLLTGCVSGSWSTHSSEPRLADHEAIEEVLARANMGFELSDADDPKTLSYDPASLRRFNRNSDDRIVILDDTTAKHTSTWMVVMHTNVNIHISAIGRYTDTLKKIGGKWLIIDRIRTE